jgi:8-oxo-dGTP pyrophosphatase MutT (NUDIX family)
MLVRDGATGMEVFMLRRNLELEFVAGAYVFPGGAVDDADRHADVGAVCDGRADEEASAVLGVAAGGLAFWVAAIRECFEEAGVLLARDAAGEVVSLADAETAARFARHRAAVQSGHGRLVEICRAEGLRLMTDAIQYHSHWVTPVGPPRRYDTRFFVAAAPPAQEPLHDGHETVASVWVRPHDALARHEAGELELILPTIRTLESLASFPTAGAALTSSAAARPAV